MEPYWKYLRENRERLENAVSAAQLQIEELTREREDAKAELKDMYVDADDSLLSMEEINYMEERLKVKLDELTGNEANLRRMEDLIAGATNSVSLITFQVFGEEKAMDVKPSNAAEFLQQTEHEVAELLRTEQDQTRVPTLSRPKRKIEVRLESVPN